MKLLKHALRAAAVIFTIGAAALGMGQTATSWGNAQVNGLIHRPLRLEEFGHEYIAITSSEGADFGLRADGHIDIAGNDIGSEGNFNPNTVTALGIAAGDLHLMIIRPDHTVTVYGWSPEADVLSVPDGLANVVQVAAGLSHCLALRADGTVVAWGDNQLGEANVPAGLDHVARIRAGGYNSYAIKDDGMVVSFGGIPAPADLGPVTDLACGYGFTLALKADGTVSCFGVDSNVTGHVPEGLSNVVKVGANWTYAFAVKSDGTVVCWGSPYSYGEPEVVMPPPAGLAPVVAITGSYDRAVALTGIAGTITPTKASFCGGSTATVKATLTLEKPVQQDYTFTLSSSDPALLSIPSTVTVPSGSTSVTVTLGHELTPDTKLVTLSATHGLSTLTGTVTVLPIIPKSLALDAGTIEGGHTINGVVTVNAIPKGDLQVALDANTPYVTVPATVTVRAKANTAVFSVQLADVPVATKATVFANYSTGYKSAYVTILPKPKLASVVTTFSTVYGLQAFSGRVTLKTPAGAQGATIGLTVSGGGLTLPATVFIPPGATFVDFDILADDVTAPIRPTITASYIFSAVGRQISLQPNVVKEIDLSPSLLGSLDSGQVTIRLASNVSVDTSVSLSLSNPGAASLPATVTILAGSSSATVSLVPNSTTKTIHVAVRAARLGRSISKTLTITP